MTRRTRLNSTLTRADYSNFNGLDAAELGVIPDGRDNGPQLLDAIALARTNNVPLLLSGGTYLTSQPIPLGASLIGVHPQKTKIAAGFSFAGNMLIDHYQGAQFRTVKNLTLDAGNRPIQLVGSSGDAEGASNALYESVYMINTPAGIYAVGGASSLATGGMLTGATFLHCRWENCSQWINVGQNQDDTLFLGCRFIHSPDTPAPTAAPIILAGQNNAMQTTFMYVKARTAAVPYRPIILVGSQPVSVSGVFIECDPGANWTHLFGSSGQNFMLRADTIKNGMSGNTGFRGVALAQLGTGTAEQSTMHIENYSTKADLAPYSVFDVSVQDGSDSSDATTLRFGGVDGPADLLTLYPDNSPTAAQIRLYGVRRGVQYAHVTTSQDITTLIPMSGGTPGPEGPTGPAGGVTEVAGWTGAVTVAQIYEALEVIEGVTVHGTQHGVVADSNGTAGNGTDNTVALRDTVAAAAAIANSVTGQAWLKPRIVLPNGTGCVRFTDWIVNTPDVAGGTQIPIRGLHWVASGRRSCELFFDRNGTATEDPRLNTAFVMGNRGIGWTFERMSFRSLNANNSCFYFWCRDTDDSALAFPAYGKGAQSSFVFDEIEWRGDWKRAIGWGGDHQANLNSEFSFQRCAVTVEATASDAFFHLGMPMFGAVHMRVTGGATGGTYTITVGADTTAPLAYNASAATIQSAITGLASVGTGNSTVTAVSDGFLIRFLNSVESIDTTTVTVATSLTGGSAPSMVMFRRPIQQSQFLNYWFSECRFEIGGGVLQRIGRGGHITHKNGSYIAVGPGADITFFKMEDEPSHAESTLHFTAEDIRFEMRAATHKVIDCKWNKGWVSFVRCSDSAYSFQSFANTLAAHTYDFTTQGLSRGPIITYRDCELIGLHQVTTHASTAATGGHLAYEDCRFMNQTTATGSGAGMVRYSGVPVPYEVQRCYSSSFTRIANSSFGW